MNSLGNNVLGQKRNIKKINKYQANNFLYLTCQTIFLFFPPSTTLCSHFPSLPSIPAFSSFLTSLYPLLFLPVSLHSSLYPSSLLPFSPYQSYIPLYPFPLLRTVYITFPSLSSLLSFCLSPSPSYLIPPDSPSFLTPSLPSCFSPCLPASLSLSPLFLLSLSSSAFFQPL